MYVGIMQVVNNNMTLGSFMAFNTLAGYFMDPIGNLVSLQLSIQEANISMKRLSEIMDYEREQKSERQYQEISSIDGDIKLDHVTFRYGNRKPALDDVSFIIEKGQKVALVGASATSQGSCCGKTSSLRLSPSLPDFSSALRFQSSPSSVF